MGKSSDALSKEVEAYEAKVRDAISELDEPGLVKWCKKEIENHRRLLAELTGVVDRKAIISRSDAIKDQDSTLELARTNRAWLEAMVQVVKERRIRNEAIPASWRDYLLNIYLGIEEGPDGRGRQSQTARNEAICRCINHIAKFTRFKAARNATSNDTPCGISIVSEALENSPGYDGVEKIWKNRDKSLLI